MLTKMGGEMNRYSLPILVIAALASTAELCPPSTLKPSIAVDVSPAALTVRGSGWANVSPCARLSFSGLVNQGQSGTLAMGAAQCTNGSFQNFIWQFSLVGTCSATTPNNATILATDPQGSNAGAQQTVAIPWGPGCALAAACGQEGQSPCPGGTCATGFVISKGVCTACGMEGVPPCPPNVCKGTDLHLNFQGGQVVCTWFCGHYQGAACPSKDTPGCSGQPPVLISAPQNACVTPFVGSDLKNGGYYACYDNGMIDNTDACQCMFNNLNTCPVSTSIRDGGSNGQCIRGKFALASGATWGSTCP
jgi:hypothetical protein